MTEKKVKESIIKAQLKNKTCGRLVKDCCYCPYLNKYKDTCNLLYAGAVYMAMLGNVEIEGAENEKCD